MPTLDAVQEIIAQHGYTLFFLLAIVEGPIVTVIAAFLAVQGYLNVVIVYIIAIAADLVGDVALYLIGRFANATFISRWGPKFGAGPEQIERLKAHFRSHGGKTLVIGKLTHSVGFVVLLGAGASSMRIGPFIWYNVLGTIPKSLLFVLMGYFFGFYFKAIDSYLARFSIVVFALAVLVAVYWLARAWRKRAATES